MDKKLYDILGVSETASMEDIKSAYETLKAKYSEERFLEGEQGNIAAKRLTEVEYAYSEILFERKQSANKDDANGLFSEIERLIKENNLHDAQEKLDSFDERSAEWHYYQSVVFYKKNWINESKKQLEIAIQIDGENQKYKDALNKLNERVNSSANMNSNWNKSGNASGSTGRTVHSGDNPQLGGDSCCQWCCDMIMCNMLLNCCCNCN